jgi:DeoR/GlpR family transcriptional regulator of sugar metabolism
VPAKAKLSEEQVKRIRRRVRAGERVSELAAEFAVNRRTIRRRLDALEQAEAEQAWRT